MPDLRVVSAKPVTLLRNGKVKPCKRKPNSLGALSTVTDFVYPGGNKKLAKDANTDPFKKKRKKVKARKRNASRPRPFRATFKGNTIGWYPTLKQADAAIERARKAEAKREAAFEKKMRQQMGLEGYRPKKRKAKNAPRKKRVKAKANRKPAKRKINPRFVLSFPAQRKHFPRFKKSHKTKAQAEAEERRVRKLLRSWGEDTNMHSHIRQVD